MRHYPPHLHYRHQQGHIMKITYTDNTVLHQIIPASSNGPSKRTANGEEYHIVGWAWGSTKQEQFWEGFFTPILFHPPSGETMLGIDLDDRGAR